jgi:hypothetical protein
MFAADLTALACFEPTSSAFISRSVLFQVAFVSQFDALDFERRLLSRFPGLEIGGRSGYATGLGDGSKGILIGGIEISEPFPNDDDK